MVAAEHYLPVAYEQEASTAVASLIPEDELTRCRVERLARHAGELVAAAAVEYNPAERLNGDIGYANLMQAIWFAAEGEPKAREMVEINARTHIWECLMKAGVVFEVEMHMGSNGRLVQHGQWLEEVYENAFRWAASGPEMQERTRLETYNGLLGATWARRGLLRGQRIVVFSPYPTSPDMTDERAREIGFFPETRSCAIQSLTMRDDGTVVQEVAFVAGVAGEGGPRHDLAAIQDLLADLGVDLDASTASAVLGSPIAMPGSVQLIDLVRAYDQHASRAGTELFFGQAVPVQDYDAYIEQCRERLANLQPLVQATVDELLRQAGSLRSPADAVRALHDIAQRLMVDHALGDDSIDERVFGSEAAAHIVAARQYLVDGRMDLFQASREEAQVTARSSSCPIGFGSGLSEMGENRTEANEVTGEKKWMKCPFCGDAQYGDPCAPELKCSNCTAHVKNGKVVSKGNGGTKKQHSGSQKLVTFGELLTRQKSKNSANKQIGLLALAA